MSPSPAQLPDIVIILADDLGHGDLSCYGASAFTTPVLDALARRGRRYTDAHAASAVCTPSRYALLTGRYPWRSPLQSGVLGGTDPALIPRSIPTLANALHELGYLTGAFGKWHLGLGWTLRDGSVRRLDPEKPFEPQMEANGWDVNYSQPFHDGPLERGFDTFFGISGSLDMPPYCFLREDRAETIPSVPKDPLVTSQRPGPSAPGWIDEDVDPRFAQEAVAWLERTTPRGPGDPPRFLYLATSAPHRPCVPAERFRGLSGIGPRADSVLMVDEIVGMIQEALAPSSRPMLIVFTSDNGAPTCYEEDGALEDHAPNGSLRGQKADVYDGGHRVPLIIAGEGIEPGTDHSLVSLLDIFPSLLFHLAGRDAIRDSSQPELDGAPWLFEGGDGSDRVLAATAFDGSFVLMQNGGTAIFSTGSGGFTEPVGAPTSLKGDTGQFFDRREDPRQTTDIWESSAPVRRSMVSQFLDETGCDAEP